MLFLAELVVPGFSIVFFGVGAWVTALAVWTGTVESFNLQLLVFVVSSGVSLVLFRWQGKAYFRGKVSGTMPADSMDDVKE